MRVMRPARVSTGEGGGGVGRRQANAAAVVPRRRGAAASNGRKSGGGGGASDGLAAAEKAEASATVAAAAMYDSSDSFENHVIDLRGDHYRNEGMRDEDDPPLRDTQSSEEVSRDNGNGREESDSDMDALRPNGHGFLSNGKADKHRNGAKQDDTAEEGSNRGPSRPRGHQFVPGQLAWAKFARFPWWPAQVMDEREAKEGRGGTPASDTDLLVRFFGTYDYGWVDPFVNLSDFEVKLAERSRIRKKALQKGVEEAIAFQSSGKLPDRWEKPVPKTPGYKTKQNGQSDGVTNSPEETKASRAADNDEPKERKTPRKRKPKVLFEEEGRVERKPQRMLRRIRVMRQLGLAAPAGSPFTDYSQQM